MDFQIAQELDLTILISIFRDGSGLVWTPESYTRELKGIA